MSRVESKDYYVLSLPEHKEFRCYIKGKFKKEFNLKKDKLFQTDIAVVGDEVEFELNPDGSGIIFQINPRKNYLSRKAPKIRGSSFKGERLEQIVASNIDQVFIVSSVSEPTFNNKTIDRFLVTCESSNLNCNIIINKSDLDDGKIVSYWTSFYTKIGYFTLPTSTVSNQNIDVLENIIQRKKSLFWGPSGVGKSSLLNKIYPHLNLKVSEISYSTMKGKHTTVTSRMFFMGDDTYIIDTPGVREIEPYGIKKEDLGHFFPDFRNFINACRFNTCTHHHEPGCAVIKAVRDSLISEIRYESYLRILNTIEDDMNL
ncbi:MAG: ribosome small subunit-dependent GTPase A [Ignavibacterium sp.]|nr:ribosome small subunit-dependent GTPase A [Ignavibacterium sp.]